MLRRHVGWFLLVLITSLVLAACGSDDNGGAGPGPVTGVDISAAETDLEIGSATEITAVVTGGESKVLSWTVNGIENGNAVYGTITQNSPVTYNAPDSLPTNATVVIAAISLEDETKSDTCHVHLRFTKIFVDAVIGDDASGSGSVNLPVRSLTYALALADSGMTVLAMPGTYANENGEVFPLSIPFGVALVGMDWEACVIRGHTLEIDSNNAILLDSGRAVFRKFTIEDAAEPEHRWFIPIYISSDYCRVDSLRTEERPSAYYLRVHGTEGVIVENCHFVVTEGEPQHRGMEIVFGNTGTILRNCTVSGYGDGLFLNGTTDALIEHCVFENNLYGVDMCCQDSETSNPNPDLGGGARGSSGGNVIRNNAYCGLRNPTNNDIYARFNNWDNAPPLDGVDFCNTGTGHIITQ
jgi:hypothetical protein